MNPELSEAKRFPLLTPAGRRHLHAMREDPHAPAWNWPNGEQLDADGLATVHAFAATLRLRPILGPGQPPDWLAAFVDFCLEDVPFYRERSRPGTPFSSIPSCNRADLAPRPWEFVPDSQPLDRLIVFSSSGTTGHPARLPTHPATAACGIPLLEHVLTPLDLRFPRGPGETALTQLAAYKGAYTTAIVAAYLEEAGCLRVNLHPDDWRAPGDRAAFLGRWQSPVVIGDPISLALLQHVPLERPPRVLISSIMTLTDGLAEQLRARYGCPVLDLYALTEAGIVAVRTPEGHAILPPDLHVEILDELDQPCQPGVRGEIVVTGGRNPFAPLLRYRTGDFAALDWLSGPILVGLEGRLPIQYCTRDDRIVHSMEVTRLLRPFPLIQFQLHQDAIGCFHFGFRGPVEPETLRDALAELLGGAQSITVASLPEFRPGPAKVREFSSDFAGPAPSPSQERPCPPSKLSP